MVNDEVRTMSKEIQTQNLESDAEAAVQPVELSRVPMNPDYAIPEFGKLVPRSQRSERQAYLLRVANIIADARSPLDALEYLDHETDQVIIYSDLAVEERMFLESLVDKLHGAVVDDPFNEHLKLDRWLDGDEEIKTFTNHESGIMFRKSWITDWDEDEPECNKQPWIQYGLVGEDHFTIVMDMDMIMRRQVDDCEYHVDYELPVNGKF